MAESTPASVSIATRDGRLRIEFQWHVDRFNHKVFLDEVEVGTSVEGDADEPWPPSPPLQQLSCEEINGSKVILGVGAAGRSHWSISVEVGQDLDSRSIKFDVASRCKDQTGFLGSTYRLADLVVLSRSNANSRAEVQQSNDCLVSVRPKADASDTHRWAYELSPKTTQNS